jgi:hypothetical protein
MTKDARRTTFAVPKSADWLNWIAWRRIAASGGAVLVSASLATINWWVVSAPRHPVGGLAWNLRPQQSEPTLVSNSISGVPAAAITLCIAVGIFLWILGRLSPRSFALATLAGLPISVLLSAAWTLLNENYSLPDWLDIGFLVPGLLALAASIWATRWVDPTRRGAEIQIVAPLEIPTRAQQEGQYLPSWTWTLPAVAALIGAGIAAWLALRLSRPHPLTWSSLLGTAARYVLTAQLAAIFSGSIAYAILKHRGASLRWRSVLRGTAAMAWLPPLVLFLTQGSWWAAMATVIVVASAATLAYSGLRADLESGAQKAVPLDFLAARPAVPFLRQMLPALTAAICLDSVLFAILANRPLVASAMCGLSAGITSWQWNSWIYPRQHRKPARFLPLAFWIMTAIAFTAGGLTRYLGEDGAIGFRAAYRAPIPSSSNLPAQRAIILFEDKRPEKLLIPPRPSFALKISARTKPQPLNIPFNGVYWLFQPPDREPGKDSSRERGDPTQLSFYSNNGRPLLMEARQNLGSLIDLRCCSEILVTIKNSEPRWRSIALHVTLANTILAGAPSVKLSAAKADSQLTDGLENRGQPGQQTLAFAIPASAAIAQFDEVIVIFDRPGRTTTSSAKVAIQGFVLMPRL